MALDKALLATREARVRSFADAATRRVAERDFGGMADGHCLLVAEPDDVEACQRLIRAFGQHGVGCTLRGTGYGQSGQSVAAGTVSLSTRRLDWVAEAEQRDRSIAVGAGATPRQVIDRLRGTGLAPPVIPLNLDMSIGGLLSAGGMGPTSHRYGPVASNVINVDVVTGDGVLRRCDRSQNRDIFDAVLGGVGQSGLITNATLALTSAPRRMRVASFLYSCASEWLKDQMVASQVDPVVHIEGFCWAAAKILRVSPSGPTVSTHWTYGLQISFDEDAPGVKGLLASIRPERKLDEQTLDFEAYVHRWEPRFAAMVQGGAWYGVHPWFEGIVPVERAEEVLLRILELLPAEVGDGHRLVLVDARRPGELAAGSTGRKDAVIGIFPPALPGTATEKVLSALQSATALVVGAGGRRYLSGWLGPDALRYLQVHFGERYDAWLSTRRRYDPHGLFRSALFPRGHAA